MNVGELEGGEREWVKKIKQKKKVMQKEMAGVEGDREEETFRHVHHPSNQTRTDTQTVQLRPEHIYFSL